MLTELKRKLFHLSALGYIALFIWLPRPVFLWTMGALLLLDVTLESLRVFYEPAHRWFAERVGFMMRTHEDRRFSGIFWMMIGVTAAALVAPPRLAVTAMLYAVLGDGIASLAGKRFKGPKWPKLEKRFTGSAANFLACLALGALILRPDHSWLVVMAGALGAVFLELDYIPLNDNFLMTAGTALVLTATAALAP